MSTAGFKAVSDNMFHGSVGALLLRLGIPIYASMLFWVLYTITDIYWISRIDPEDSSIVGGVSLIIPVYMLAFAVSNGLLVGVKSLVARAIGANNEAVLNKVASAGMLLAGILSVLFMLFGYMFSNELTNSLGAKGDLFAHAHTFLLYLLPAAALLFLFNVLSGIAQGEGRMKYVMNAMGLGVGLNLLLDPLLILWWGLGVAGGGLATSLSQAISLLYLVAVFLLGGMRVPLHLNILRADAGTIMKVLRVGLPQALAEILVAFFLLAVNWIVVGVDPEAMTAFGFCARVDQVVLLSIAAIASAVMTAVAQNASRGSFGRVREIQKTAMIIGVGVVFLQAGLLFWGAPRIYSLLSETYAVIGYAVLQTRIVEFFYMFSVITLVSHSFFLAVGHPWPAVTIQLVKMFGISLPVIFVLVFAFDLGMYGVWLGIITGEFLGAFLSMGWSFGVLNRLAVGTLQVAETKD